MEGTPVGALGQSPDHGVPIAPKNGDGSAAVAATMRRALFVASGTSYFREMAPVVWNFADKGGEVRVLLGSVSPLSEDAVAECQARGIRADIAPLAVGYGSDP